MRRSALISIVLAAGQVTGFSVGSSTFCRWCLVAKERTSGSRCRAIRNAAEDASLTGSQSSATNLKYMAALNKTVSFDSFYDLMNLDYGQHVNSDVFSMVVDDTEIDFRVKLYPRGGGQDPSVKSSLSGDQKSGFGMSYRVLPMFGKSNEKVGAYLEYAPRNDGGTGNIQSVDASFGMTLLGQQQSGPRFNVEWRAGMRFVPLSETKLAEGRANDFGASLMQTPLLAGFMGLDEDGRGTSEPLKMQVEVLIHRINKQSESELEPASATSRLLPRDIREGEGSGPSHSNEVRVGKVVVPVLNSLGQRNRMFAQGCYPGVEYRILRMVDPESEQEVFDSQPGVDYHIKPIYPLVQQLERPWPVVVNEADIPKLLTPNMYNFISAIGSLATAFTGLLAAFVVSQAISFFVIPSLSMDPTLQKGDVLLVEKVTPRLIPQSVAKNGNVVFFHPPSALRDIVQRNGGRINERDLFVKRVIAGPGDTFSVMDKQGQVSINGQEAPGRRDLCKAEPLGLIRQYITPTEETRIKDKEVVVLGDCSSVSIDSRVWGPLEQSDIVGRPLLRLWPLERFGAIPDIPNE